MIRLLTSTVFLLPTLGLAQEVDPELYAAIPGVTRAALSPNGAYVASIGLFDRMHRIAIYDVDRQQFLLIYELDGRFNWLRWADDERLLVSSRYHAGRLAPYPTTLTVIEPKSRVVERLGLAEWWPNERDKVVAVVPKVDGTHLLVRYGEAERRDQLWDRNLDTGESVPLLQRVSGRPWWYVDSAGRARLELVLSDNGDPSVDSLRVSVWDGNLEAWRGPIDRPVGFVPLVLDRANPDAAMVASDHIDGKLGLYRWNLHDQSFDMPPVVPPRREFHRVIYNPQRTEILGVRFVSDAAPIVWLKPEHANTFRRIEAALPGRRVDVESVSDDLGRAVVLAAAPNSAGQYYLFDGSNDALTPLDGPHARWVNERISPVQRVRIEAPVDRDVDAYLSRASGADNVAGRPPGTVVIPHGGPYSRDFFGFDPLVQLLNKSGYTVLQLDGQRRRLYPHELFGDYRWLPDNADAVVAATDWLVQEGIADADRICVLGLEHGGYSALSAAVAAPEKYSCVVSINGPSSRPNPLHGGGFEDRYGLPKLFWPAEHADEFAASLLLFHGDENMLAPLGQARGFQRRLKRAGKDVELIVLEGEDHQITGAESRRLLIVKLLSFLRTHLD